MNRVFNFSAGPAAIPEIVLRRARDELLDYGNSGMSVMELSHRSVEFVGVAERAEADLRELMSVPENYHVLFLQGGATGQFAGVPLNLTRSADDVADYVCTGSWSKKAVAEARRYCTVNVAADAGAPYAHVPPQDGWKTRADARYLHYTPNETIGGVEFGFIPETDVPLVADMSSSILSQEIDVSRFGVIYAGAQKNIGPAGLTVVIVRDDLAGAARDACPQVLEYGAQAKAGSMLNTPPTLGWYLAGQVFRWLREQGGVAAIAEANTAKAKRLYDYIDGSGFYSNPVAPGSRSRMNVPFTLAVPDLDAAFLAEAADRGLTNLKGHRSVGGMRASIYNAMPMAGVEALIEHMQDFARRNG